MSKKITYIHAENNNKILSSNEVRLYVPPEPEKMKVIIWGKELCNIAEWNDFLKCVEEKTEENNQLKQQNEELMLQLSKYETEEHKPAYCTLAGTECEYLGNVHELKQQLAEKDKEIELLKHLGSHETNIELFKENTKLIIEKRQLAIQELEKVKDNLKDRISMMKNEEHSYLQKVVAWYDICEQINKQIKALKGE